MDQFSFTRQTAAFLAILALLEVLIVLAFPLLVIVSAVIAAIFIILVWLKAGIRTRKWLWWNPGRVPLTQAEGAVAVSAALLFACGVLVGGYEAIRYASGERDVLTGYAFRHMTREVDPNIQRPVGMRGTHYSDPDRQMALKAELTRADVPFKLETTDGKEYVMWAPEHDAAVEEIRRKLHEGPSSLLGGSVHFGQPATQQAFKEWLLERGIAYEIRMMRGEEYVVWKDGPRELAMEFAKQHYRPCPEETAARGSGKAEQPRC